jgi:hypothetical protein
MAEFDPDQYLAGEAFDPDAYLKENPAREKRGVIETAIVHGGQGLSAGLTDEGTGLVTGLLASGPGVWLREKTGILPLVDTPSGKVDPFAPYGGGFKEGYEGGRDESRQGLKETKEDHKGVAVGAEIVGSVISPINKIAPGAKIAGKVLPKATTAGGRILTKAAPAAIDAGIQGGIAGAGYSEADNLTDLAKDTALGLGVGAGAGAAMGTVLQGGREVADNAYVRQAMGRAPKSAPAPVPSLMPEPVAALPARQQQVVQIVDGPRPLGGVSGLARDSAEAPVGSILKTGKLAPAKTEIGALSEPETWHEFLKGRIEPAMRENNNNAAKAIKELSVEWKALQKKRGKAKTRYEPDTLHDNSPDVLPGFSKTEPNIDAAKARAAARAPSDVDPFSKTGFDASYAHAPAGKKLVLDGASVPPGREEILDKRFRSDLIRKATGLGEKAAEKRENLTRQILSEINEGAEGIRELRRRVRPKGTYSSSS